MPHPSSPTTDGVDPRIARFCRAVGASDLASWLGIAAPFTSRQALSALDRKRRELERRLGEPEYARQAELLEASWEVIRAALVEWHDTAVAEPDHYRALGLPRSASYTEIESAWRSYKEAGRVTPGIESAWRVLGDPFERARYDRARRPDSPSRSPSPRVAAKADVPRLRIDGPELRRVELGRTTLERGIHVRVSGGTWTGTITSDHPVLSAVGPSDLSLKPGQHTLQLRFSPEHLAEGVAIATLRLAGDDRTHSLTFRIARVAARSTFYRNMAMGLLVFIALLVTYALGSATRIRVPEAQPVSIGRIAQVPAVGKCLPSDGGPIPSWIDIHVDGLGRPTGFNFGENTKPEVEICVRNALQRLEFPPTTNGLPAFHRYLIAAPPPTQGTP